VDADQMIIPSLCFTFALLFSSLALSDDIADIWKHAEHPAWIEINMAEGRATAFRNDNKPERGGREMLKEIKASSKLNNLWNGMLYVEKLGEYKRVEISMPDNKRMLITAKVGFFSGTVEWLRDDKP
jgi:hypothetical protein